MAFRLKEGWKVKGRDISWLETIAVELITHVLDAWDVHESRVVIHSNNQGTISAMAKGRSPNFHINLAVHCAYSILIPRFIVPSFVYIESAANPANPISRGLLGPDDLRIPIRISIPPNLSAAISQR
jgi:hypothetical protein